MKYIVSASLFAALLGATTQSHAVYNLYKKDGLTLDINGQIDMQATKQDQRFELVEPAYQGSWDSRGRFVTTQHPAGYAFESTDKKPRLGQNNGVSYVDIRGSQTLPDDWRVTGNIGLNYDTDRQLYLSNSSLSFDKKGLGAVSVGRQYLHAGYVNRTDTDTPLDIFSASSVRADYTAIDGLHASAYYSFTGSADIRIQDNLNQKNGYGASLSHRYDLGQDQYVRTAAGVSFAEYNPVTEVRFLDNTLNRYPKKTQGVAGSVEYRTGPLLLAADIGRKNETMSESTDTPLDKKVSNYLGAKVAYRINPVLQVSTGYGTKKTKASLKADAAPLFNTNDVAVIGDNRYSFVNADERYLFDNINTKEMYAQVDYLWRPNVRFYGRYDDETITNTLAGQTFSKLKDKNYRAGIVFAF